MRLSALLSMLLAGGQVWASGYEKSIMWGGQSGGLAGIATPYIQGSQALYFNPAGLVSERAGHDISLSVSPTSSKFKGPINNNNDQETSEDKVSTPFGLIYGATVNEKLGFGIGGYVSGGSYANYEGVEYTSTVHPNVKTDLQVSEIAAGIGYRVTEDLKLGFAYRVVMARADFSFIQRAGSPAALPLLNVTVEDMEDTNYTGFKLGAQYDLSETTRFGFAYRSEVELEAEGKFGGSVYAGPVLPIDANDATAETTFPMQATLGVQHDLNENWRLFGEYAWTQYSKVDKIVVKGTLSRSNGAAVLAQNPEIEQHWDDQHNIRVASEYLGWGMPFRFGYGWTSQVTNERYARAAFTAPGPAHTLTVGTGRTIGETFKVDGGFEYTWIEAEGNGTPAGTVGNDYRQGDYVNQAYALHLGVSYLF